MDYSPLNRWFVGYEFLRSMDDPSIFHLYPAWEYDDAELLPTWLCVCVPQKPVVY